MTAFALYRLLAASTVLSLSLALSFLLLAVALWAANKRREARVSKLREAWQSRLFEKISNPSHADSAAVADKDASDYIEFLLDLALRFQGAARDALQAEAAPYLPRALKLCHSRSAHDRAWAIRAIGTFGLPKNSETLRRALSDPEPPIRMIAFRYLVQSGGLEHVDEMVSGLSAFRRWNMNLLASLFSTLGPTVSPKLNDHFSRPSTPPHVRAILAIALRQLNDPSAAFVAESILNDPSCMERSLGTPDLAAACLRLLYASGTERHAATVRKLCASAHPVVRAQALRALGKLGNDADAALLSESLRDPDNWISLQAAAALKELGARKALEDFAASGHPQSVFARQVLLEAS